ncbi:MAG: PQQ-binding-like beta-propeller repeat protein [Phycisphaeraceae bacterium]|nr:MAG: PQQ-binding-like beta-propeller repeat protein [Phycisphaeraceae bacterium]
MNPVFAHGRPPRLAALLAACLLAAGCTVTPSGAGEKPGTKASAKQPAAIGVVTTSRGVRIVHDDWATLGYRWEWSTTPLAAGRGVVGSVDILGDVIAVQSKDAWTALVQANTGNRLWQVRNTSPLTEFEGNVRVNDVLISCARPELFIMELGSGNLIARQPVDVVISTPPLIDGGLAVFGTPTGRVLCHRFGKASGEPLPPPFADGAMAWEYSLDGAITATPVQLGGLAGVVTQAGEVFFVDIASGSGAGRSQISGGVATDPVTDGQTMFVASLDQSIYAFQPGRSTWTWRYRTADPLRIQPTCHDGVLYLDVPSEGLIAFDVSGDSLGTERYGRKLWVNSNVVGRVVAMRSDELIVWDGKSATLVDKVGGDTIASIKLPKFTRLIPSTFVDGDLYALAENGLLAKFSPRR